MSNTAIADHALLCDRHCAALVDRSAFVEWLSFPTFRRGRWKRQCEEIWDTVVRGAWSMERAFTQYVGPTAMDASN
jgi:hypothetical protein